MKKSFPAILILMALLIVWCFPAMSKAGGEPEMISAETAGLVSVSDGLVTLTEDFTPLGNMREKTDGSRTIEMYTALEDSQVKVIPQTGIDEITVIFVLLSVFSVILTIIGFYLYKREEREGDE